jgi:hypothetical protein
MSDGSRHQLAGVMRVERRVARRYATSLGIAFVRNGQVHRATAVDVSMTGMRLETEIDLDVGLELSAHFSLQASAQMHLLEARVAWSVPSGEIAGLFLVGMEYRRLPPDTQEALAGLIRELGGDVTADDLPVVDDRDVTAVPSVTGPAVLTPSSPPRARNCATTDAGEARRRKASLEQAAALCVQARAAQRATDLPRAVGLLRQAVELAPELPDAIEELAAAVYLAGDVVESARLFDRALRLRLEKGV